MTEMANGEDEMFQSQNQKKKPNDNFSSILHRLIYEAANAVPLLHQIKASSIVEASRNYTRRILLWSRQGSALRPLILIFVGSLGTITLVALAGLFAFMLFFLAATITAILVSLLVSLAVVGGFLALFSAFVTAIYIGVLAVAIFATATVMFWTTVAIVITTVWIGFFYTVWLVTRKSLGFAKQSMSVTGSAITTYAAAWGTRNLEHTDSD